MQYNVGWGTSGLVWWSGGSAGVSTLLKSVIGINDSQPQASAVLGNVVSVPPCALSSEFWLPNLDRLEAILDASAMLCWGGTFFCLHS